MHILDEDSQDLAALGEFFFDDDALKDEYENGSGIDLLYFESLELQPTWRGRTIEEAIVRLLLDTWGTGGSGRHHAAAGRTRHGAAALALEQMIVPNRVKKHLHAAIPRVNDGGG